MMVRLLDAANPLNRLAATGNDLEVLGDIYQEAINIAIWQRDIDASLSEVAIKLIEEQPHFQTAISVAPENVKSALAEELRSDEYDSLIVDIAYLADMFACLFELSHLGLRLRVLDRAMCPKFHVDKVPCRLITTYTGVATEWLPHKAVNRGLLGSGSKGISDDKSGLYENQSDIQILSAGDVALLKGESWRGNEGAGLVHRSPQVNFEQQRLLLTFDFAD